MRPPAYGAWHLSSSRSGDRSYSGRLGAGLLRCARAVAERLGDELVAPEQLVELGAIAAGEARGERDLPVGRAQQIDQIVALEAIPRFRKRHGPRALATQRAVNERHRDE